MFHVPLETISGINYGLFLDLEIMGINKCTKRHLHKTTVGMGQSNFPLCLLLNIVPAIE